jgi:hypothetical protein
MCRGLLPSTRIRKTRSPACDVGSRTFHLARPFARLRFACLHAAQRSTADSKALCAQVGLRGAGVYRVRKHA